VTFFQSIFVLKQPTLWIENFRNMVVEIVNNLNSKKSHIYRLLAQACENRVTFIIELQIT
jgi:hypothetical protein